jgi:hypothetical protein
MGHADVNKMPYPGALCLLDGAAAGCQVDTAELRRFRRTGMRDANQLHKSVGGSDVAGVGFSVQSIAEDELAAGGKPFLRPRPNQRQNFVTTLEQLSDQGTADIPRASGDENAMVLSSHYFRIHYLRIHPDFLALK